jgi:hypothetical protein
MQPTGGILTAPPTEAELHQAREAVLLLGLKTAVEQLVMHARFVRFIDQHDAGGRPTLRTVPLRGKTPQQAWDELAALRAAGGDVPEEPSAEQIRALISIAPTRARWIRNRISDGLGRPEATQTWA